MRTRIIILLLSAYILLPCPVLAFDYPNDQPTIEALISLHKLLKKKKKKLWHR